MFYIKNNAVYSKQSNKIFEINTVLEISSEILKQGNRYYINAKVHKNESVLHMFDQFCKTIKNNYSATIEDQKIFLKLPFRYNRFDIKFDNLKTSEYFQIGKTFDCTIRFGGFVLANGNIASCFKVVHIW